MYERNGNFVWGVRMSGVDADKKEDFEDIELEETVDESAYEEEEEEEIALGGTPAGAATNEALRALARAARSFLIYDPRNEAIRGFLQSYRESIVPEECL